MSILIANSGNRVVSTIAERDAITKRFDGMNVFVRDATADPIFGGGTVQYLWDGVIDSWSPVWSEKKPELRFTIEDKVLVNGQVTADQVIKDGVVWSARILDDDDTILADARVTLSGRTLDIGSLAFDGKRLHYTYAYGEMTTLLTELWEDKADKESPELTGIPLTTIPTDASPAGQIAPIGWVTEQIQEAIGDLPQPGDSGIPEAPVDDKAYVRENGEWVELDKGFNAYSLLTSTSASGDLVVTATDQQVFTLESTAGSRNVSFINGPAGRAITAVLVIIGKNVPVIGGVNFKWNNGEVPTTDVMGDTKTVITAFWDGIDTWIISVGPKY